MYRGWTFDFIPVVWLLRRVQRSAGHAAPPAQGLHATTPSSAATDILNLAYYSGWRKNEILGLTWDEIDEAGGVIRLSPGRSKTLVRRILPISQPIAEALARRRARRDPTSPLVFHRDSIPVRRWRTAWRTACQATGVPTRFLHDCRRTMPRHGTRASAASEADARADADAPRRVGQIADPGARAPLLVVTCWVIFWPADA